MADFDSIQDASGQQLASPAAPQQVVAASSAPPPSSFDDIVDVNDQYGTADQQVKAGIEGVAKGVLGPLAPAAEKFIGINPEDIRHREEANPITSGVGQAVGLGAGFLTGTGEAAVMEGAGKVAAEALGLSSPATLLPKIGSEAVQQAAQMAVLQSGDEASKMILEDPEASAQTALTNIGLASALGGAAGSLFGAAHPLWEATGGKALNSILEATSRHLDGKSAMVLPEMVDSATKELGLELDPIQRAIVSGDHRANEAFQTLKVTRNEDVLQAVENLDHQVSQKVLDSLGIPIEEAKTYSDKELGDKLLDTFKQEYKARYEPQEIALNARNQEAAKISVDDKSKLDLYGRLIENGMQKVGTDSPIYKQYTDWGNRILAKDTLGGMDQLKTELQRDIKKAFRAGDDNTAIALKDIRSSIHDFQEHQITKQAAELGAEGKKLGSKLVNERAEVNRSYSDFAKLSNELMDHLGVGEFGGAGRLVSKLDGVGPEGLLNKFSPRGNAGIIDFLKQHFPATAEVVRQNELLKLIKPALEDKSVNVNKLSKILEKAMAGKKELVGFAMPERAVSTIQAAKTLLDAVPAVRDSGTPGHIAKIFNKMPASTMAAVAMLSGHNPFIGGLLGELSQALGRNVPDALRLGMLRFLGSTEPIQASGFKAMVDFIHNTVKGETLLVKSTQSIFKSGAQVLPTNLMPSAASREKLDKKVQEARENPQMMMQLTGSQVGHYLAPHQTALTQTAANTLNYLQKLKPQSVRPSPLDKEIEPSKDQIARYNRALDIAHQPLIVMDHIKRGTILPSDVQDISAMYPGLYRQMSKRISDALASQEAHKEPIPYKTKMGMSLFLGHAIDSTMTPQSIVSAQTALSPQQPNAPQQGAPKGSKKGTNTLGKSNSSYMTPDQAREAHHAKQD